MDEYRTAEEAEKEREKTFMQRIKEALRPGKPEENPLQI